MKEVRNIQKVILNGKKAKLFEVWGYLPESKGWLLVDKSSAPQSVANKNLLEHYLSK